MRVSIRERGLWCFWFERAYQVTNELGGVGGQGIRRQSHTKGETPLGLSAPVGDAPGVEDDAGVRVSEGHGDVVLGNDRRQDYRLSVSHGRVEAKGSASNLQHAAAARPPTKREEVLMLLECRNWFASTLPACEHSKMPQPRTGHRS